MKKKNRHRRKARGELPSPAQGGPDAPADLGAALGHLHAGMPSRAEQTLREILSAQPRKAEIHYYLGDSLQAQGRLEEAVSSYRRAAEIRPDFSDAFCSLGSCLLRQGKFDEATASLQEAIRIDPGHGEAHKNLGAAWLGRGLFDNAMQCFRAAVRAEPRMADAHNFLGLCLHLKGRWEEAIACFHTALEIKPDFPNAHFNLGNCLQKKSDLDGAILSYRRALRQSPGDAELHYNIGTCLFKKELYDDAISSLGRALEAHPRHDGALNNIGAAYLKKRAYSDALPYLNQALEINPGHVAAHNNLGAALEKLGRSEESISVLRRALALDPQNGETHNFLGVAHQMRGEYPQAAACLERSLAISPDSPDARFNYSALLLAAEKFREGWKYYEARLERSPLSNQIRKFQKPRWDGSPLGEKTLLLHPEQGIGDTFQFIRYLGQLDRFGGKIIVQCQRGLKNILRTVPGAGSLYEAGEDLPEFDLCASLLSLPYLLDTTARTIPGRIPYIHPPENHSIRAKIRSEDGHPKIGLVWAGNPNQANDHNRSMPLEKFGPLLNSGAARFFSLQVGNRAGDISRCGFTDVLTDLSGSLSDFSATAAAIDELDLVITVCTSVAHLAGAMGQPVWTMLCFAADWRWFLDRRDSPWYPTMRLFRQKRSGHWEGVIEEVMRAIPQAV